MNIQINKHNMISQMLNNMVSEGTLTQKEAQTVNNKVEVL